MESAVSDEAFLAVLAFGRFLLIAIAVTLTSGCGVEGEGPLSDDGPVCLRTYEVTTDLDGSACWQDPEGRTPARCCLDGFDYAGVNGTAVVCVETW